MPVLFKTDCCAFLLLLSLSMEFFAEYFRYSMRILQLLSRVVPAIAVFGGGNLKRLLIMRIVTLLLAGLCASLHAQSHTIPDLQHAKQIIVVTTPGWNAVDGTLTSYSRRPKGWARVTDPIPIVVGKNGLAWDPKTANG